MISTYMLKTYMILGNLSHFDGFHGNQLVCYLKINGAPKNLQKEHVIWLINICYRPLNLDYKNHQTVLLTL